MNNEQEQKLRERYLVTARELAAIANEDARREAILAALAEAYKAGTREEFLDRIRAAAPLEGGEL